MARMRAANERKRMEAIAAGYLPEPPFRRHMPAKHGAESDLRVLMSWA